MAWHDFLTPVLKPLLALGSFWAILIISLFISLTITLVYKWVTDQKLMKSLKEGQKEMQEKIKSLRDNPQEMMVAQKEAMKKNMEYMKHSFKPTLITIIPIIIIFGWMAAHFSFEPIYPGETYSVSATFQEGITGEVTLIVDDGTDLLSEAKQEINSRIVERKASFGGKETEGNSWNLKSDAGQHLLTISTSNSEQTKKIVVGEGSDYAEPIEAYDHSDIKDIQIDYNKLKPINELLSTDDKKAEFSIFGWQPGWLGLYIVFSLVFSMSLRKILKIY